MAPFFTPVRDRTHPIIPNKLAKEYAALLNLVRPWPARLIGGQGWGKSVLLRVASESEPYEAINFHAGTNIEHLVGMWHPKPLANGVTVVWEDGPLSRCVKSGRRFFGEEWSRLTPEPKARVMGLLDETNRYWPMPERGGEAIEVHPNFQFITTENPHGRGYATQKEDPAIAGRFAITLYVDEPLCDEFAVLDGIFGGDNAAAERVNNFAVDCRSKPDTKISTRDLVQLAKLIGRGLAPVKAVEHSVVPKFPFAKDVLLNLAQAHFGNAS